MSDERCELCGGPMPPGEEMFKYHGYSGSCPKPPLPSPAALPVSEEPPTVFHPVQGDRKITSMPESVVLKAYEVYCHCYGAQPAMVDVAKGCRGGFSSGELIAFLYARSFPKAEWGRRVDEALARKAVR
jgi:hypothetical protein